MKPSYHGLLCRDLDRLKRPYARRLDMWPRGNLKTHIISIGRSIQDYLNDHEVRILLVGANQAAAKKNLSYIKRHFETNAVLHWLFPECVPDISNTKWTETEICLPRTRNLPEPTFKAVGVGGHITGWHFDIIRKDDMIDEKTEKSPEVMEKIIDWHLLSKNLLDSPFTGIDHVVGTPWLAGDVYGFIAKDEREYEIRRVSIIYKKDEELRSVWPERFPVEELLKLREKDPYMFACQQMCNPVDEAVVAFNPKWLRYYEFHNENMDIEIEASAL